MSNFSFVVRTINTAAPEPHNPLRLRGIAREIFNSSQEEVGIIGLQEAKSGMTGCKISNQHNNAATCLAAELSHCKDSPPLCKLLS